MGKKLTVTKKTSQHTTTPILRRTAIATAIAAIITPTGLQADNWQRNIEFFVAPTNKARALMGGAILQPLFQNENSLTYADLRAIFRFAQTEEFNFGLGHRMMYNDWILGGYFSFDTRNTERDVQHHAVTFGLEALSRQWDVNFNYYLPISGKETVATGTLGGTFIGTTLFANGVVEEALEGVDFEVGALLPFVPIGETRLFLGTYYFDGDVAPSTGMGKKIRLEFRPRKNITLNFQATDDRLFDSEFSVQIKYSFGYAAESGVRTLSERMIQFHERDIDIKTTAALPDLLMESGTTDDRVLISDNVIHIDNTAAMGGDGSVNAPFDNIADAIAGTGATQADAFFYISAGDNTTPLTDTINLRDNQIIFGEGANLFGLGGVGNFPLIDAGGAGVVLANNNEVAGLRFENHTYGVIGENVTGFNIHDNQFDSNYNAIRIATSASNGYGYPDTVSTTGTIANNLIDGGGGGIGIRLINKTYGVGTSATQTIAISGNTIRNTGYALLATNHADYYKDSIARQTLNLSDNTMDGNSYGGAYFYNKSTNYDDTNYDNPAASSATQIVNISGTNSFSNNGDHGIRATNYAGGYYDSFATQNITLAGTNTLEGNDFGANFTNYGYYTGTANQTITLSGNNSFSNNNDGGAYFINGTKGTDTFGDPQYSGTANQTIILSGTNHFDNNLDDSGAYFYNNANIDYNGYGIATQKVILSGTTTFSGNDRYGVTFHNHAESYGTANQIVDISGSATANGNGIGGEDGYGFQADNFAEDNSTAYQKITLTGSLQSSNNDRGGFGIYNESEDSADAIQNIDLSGAVITNNALLGVDITNDNSGNSAPQNVNLSGADLSGNVSGAYGEDGNGDVTPP